MAAPDLVLDSSALFAGVASPTGAARVLLLLAETGRIRLTISDQVLVETERALTRKLPSALPAFQQVLHSSQVRRVNDPTQEAVVMHHDLIRHTADIPIVLAAMDAGVDFLVTLNRRHFIDDPEVARKSGLRIGTPGDALAWVRQQLTGGGA